VAAGAQGCYVCVAAQGLGKKQAELLDPLVEFVSELLGTRVKTSDALLGAEQTPDATSQLERHLRSLSHYELAALDSLSGVGKSTVSLAPRPTPPSPCHPERSAARMADGFQY
jgi:chaperone required for assembly of F1-ATPase